MTLAQTLNDGFEVFFGIDQTGARFRDGAKPMPVAMIFRLPNGRHELTSYGLDGKPLFINHFCFSEFARLLEAVGLQRSLLETSKVAILVDCVFGLAVDAWPSADVDLPQLFARAAAASDGYGLQAAAKFFDAILAESPSQDSFPMRRCERIARANSVFRTQPYQKNIQCGTFRIWRDLGLSERRSDWLNFRYFTKARDAQRPRPWIFEAYPSLMWRQELEVPTRKLAELASSVKRQAPELELHARDLERALGSPDAADSLVLAIGGYLLQKSGRLIARPSKKSWLAREGWIAGL